MLDVFLAAFHLPYRGAWLPELGGVAGLASQPALRGSCTLAWQTLGLQGSCHKHLVFKWVLWIPTPAHIWRVLHPLSHLPQSLKNPTWIGFSFPSLSTHHEFWGNVCSLTVEAARGFRKACQERWTWLDVVSVSLMEIFICWIGSAFVWRTRPYRWCVCLWGHRSSDLPGQCPYGISVLDPLLSDLGEKFLKL